MLGFLFLLVIEWIMRRTVEGANTGIGWKLWSKSDDLDFVDDRLYCTYIQHKGQIQQKVENLAINRKAIGLKINSKKTKLLTLSTSINETVQVNEQDIKDVESFVYLGAHNCMTGGMVEDIKARLGKATTTYNKLGKIWKSSHFINKTKIKIFKSNVIWVLLYGCET